MCDKDIFDNVNLNNPDVVPLIFIRRTGGYVVNINACKLLVCKWLAGQRGVLQDFGQYIVYGIRSSNRLSFF